MIRQNLVVEQQADHHQIRYVAPVKPGDPPAPEHWTYCASRDTALGIAQALMDKGHRVFVYRLVAQSVELDMEAGE